MELSGEKLNKAADYAEASFRLMWKLFSENGRGRALTGMEDASEGIRTIVRDTYLVDSCPIYELEIPLSGEPYADFTVGYYAQELPDQINIVGNHLKQKEELIKHYQEMFVRDGDRNEVCFEFDVFTGETKLPAYGVVPYDTDDHTVSTNQKRIKDFCIAIHQEDRIDVAIKTYDKAPVYWKPLYQGVSDVREDAPMRIAWLLDCDCKKDYRNDPEMFKKDLVSVRESIEDDSMIDQMLEVLSGDGAVELQMDLFKDGSFSPFIGMCIQTDSFSEEDPQKSFEDYIKLGQKWGIADDRCKYLSLEKESVTIPYYDEEKGMIHKRINLGLFVLKFKWSKKGVMPLKAYYYLKSSITKW